ncbi:penicillin-binding transpeptidase domain-containing protein [Halobacillus litoralis]|uniref:penicillin-binding transpeptidase domain-containing protein n=1 Tax=Halobacillus litoralis TaxID=45668 RepID=UPI001CFD9A4E|nr:penicillin-binding transpeptidase domain-containing protein [Halobacillus litoralis]
MKRWKGLLCIFVFAVLAACSEQPRPEDTFTSYMDAWENGNYEDMYSLLSEQAKGEVSKEDFIAMYTDSYEEITMKDLSITYELPEEEQEYEKESTPSFNYTAMMDSLGGKIDFGHEAVLVYEEGEDEDRWALQWTPSMIFPEMEVGDEVNAVSIAPERGEIFDVNGEGLAVNGIVKQVGLVPERMEDISEKEVKELKNGLAEILNISVEYIDDQLGKSWVKPDSFVPLVSIANDNKEAIDAINDLPDGRTFLETQARVYPLGKAAAHLTGFYDDITADKLKEREGEGYTSTSKIGFTGLEAQWEEQLKGTSGGRVTVANSEGEVKNVLAEVAAVDGKDFTLTVSSEAQRALFEEMKGESGSAAAINPSSGEVKALVSMPSYDPNEKVLNTYEGTIPLNKIKRTYSPGSTFKPITASVGLETGAITPSEEMEINGEKYEAEAGYNVTRIQSAANDTQVDLRDALVRSDNIYFARKIVEIGAESFLDQVGQFGFNEEIPFTYFIEGSQVASEDTITSESLLAATGYGQGQVEVSALHLGVTYTPFVTGGTLLKPTLLAEEATGQAWHENVISEETASLVTERLKAVVDDSEGTAYKPVIEGLNLAGKTGTAELKKAGEEDGQENGWFIAWDTENEDLLVSMMIEDTEVGSHEVVPKVKNVFEKLK